MSTCVFICEYSRAFSSLTLASFDSRVGKASLACARSHSRTLACNIASDTSHSHSFVKLRLSGTVFDILCFLSPVLLLLNLLPPNIHVR